MRELLEKIASYIVPSVLLLCAILTVKNKECPKAFVSGAKDGLKTVVGLLPTMVMLTVGLSMFCASGAVEWLTSILSPVCKPLGIMPEILPLIISRPVSGSASTAAYAELLSKYGADSPAAVCAGILMGSSDTLIYVISVYFSAAPEVKNTRHTFWVAGAVSLLCVLLSCRLFRALFT